VDRFGQREHLKGVAVYDANGVSLAVTSGLASLLWLRPTAAAHAAERDAGFGEFLQGDAPIHVYALPLHRNGQMVGTLALVNETTYIDQQVAHTLRDSLVNALVQTLLITLLALILVRWTLTGPLTRTASGCAPCAPANRTHPLRSGGRAFRSAPSRSDPSRARPQRRARHR